jgi:hypothetical protein
MAECRFVERSCILIEKWVLFGLIGFALLFKGLFVFFKVFDKVIFLAEFKVVSEMVNLLMGQKAFLIDLIESILFAPNDIPVVVECLFIASIFKGFKDAVSKVSAVLDLRTDI